MKIALRIAAVLSFLCFFCAGVALLQDYSTHKDASNHLLAYVLGLFFIGTACFVGPMLLFAAEKCGRKEEKRQ
jgi:hypothetical protein